MSAEKVIRDVITGAPTPFDDFYWSDPEVMFTLSHKNFCI